MHGLLWLGMHHRRHRLSRDPDHLCGDCNPTSDLSTHIWGSKHITYDRVHDHLDKPESPYMRRAKRHTVWVMVQVSLAMSAGMLGTSQAAFWLSKYLTSKFSEHQTPAAFRVQPSLLTIQQES